MIGLLIALGLVALVVFVGLRRSMPVGVALDPWPYIVRMPARDRFQQDVARDGVACEAVPPRDLLRSLEAIHPGFRGLTRCWIEPHRPRPAAVGVWSGPTRASVAHVGLLITREGSHSYTWIEGLRPEPTYRPRRRALWRRVLIRVAT